jgi:hypothetical protein
MSWMRLTCKLGRFTGHALLVLGSLGLGCGDDTQNPPRTDGSVRVQLDHSVGGQPLVFQDRRYTNAAGNHYEIYELKYYISNLRLLGSAGEITVGDTHYRDAAVAATRTWTFDVVPNGDYTGMRFTFGLDSLRNVTGGLPLTNENFAMAWPPDLGGGYHLMMLDGTFTGSSPNDPWLAHLGRLKTQHRSGRFGRQLRSRAPLPEWPRRRQQRHRDPARHGDQSVVHGAARLRLRRLRRQRHEQSSGAERSARQRRRRLQPWKYHSCGALNGRGSGPRR